MLKFTTLLEALKMIDSEGKRFAVKLLGKRCENESAVPERTTVKRLKTPFRAVCVKQNLEATAQITSVRTQPLGIKN